MPITHRVYDKFVGVLHISMVSVSFRLNRQHEAVLDLSKSRFISKYLDTFFSKNWFLSDSSYWFLGVIGYSVENLIFPYETGESSSNGY